MPRRAKRIPPGPGQVYQVEKLRLPQKVVHLGSSTLQSEPLVKKRIEPKPALTDKMDTNEEIELPPPVLQREAPVAVAKKRFKPYSVNLLPPILSAVGGSEAVEQNGTVEIEPSNPILLTQGHGTKSVLKDIQIVTKSPKMTRSRHARILLQQMAKSKDVGDILDVKERDGIGQVPGNGNVLELDAAVAEVKSPEGRIYEDGLVWEDAPPPPIKGTKKGILKEPAVTKHKVNESKKEAQQNVNVEQNDKLLDTPETKKSKMNISFSENPHHVRYFYSPNVSKSKKLRARRVARKRNLEENNKTPTSHNNPGWNANQAQIKPIVINFGMNVVVQNKSKKNLVMSKVSDLPKVDPVPSDSATNTRIFPFGPGLTTSTETEKSTQEKLEKNLMVDSSTFGIKETYDLNDGASSQGFDTQSPSPVPCTVLSPPAVSQLSSPPAVSQLSSPPTVSQLSSPPAVSQLGSLLPPLPTEVFDGVVITITDEEEINTEDVLSTGSMIDEEEFVNSETGTYDKNPLCPELFDCDDSVATIIKYLTYPVSEQSLLKIFDSVGILTIGDLSRQTQLDLIKWPLIAPKYERTFRILNEYRVSKELEAEARRVHVVNDLLLKPIRYSGAAAAAELPCVPITGLPSSTLPNSMSVGEKTLLSPQLAETVADSEKSIIPSSYSSAASSTTNGYNNIEAKYEEVLRLVKERGEYIPTQFDSLLVLGEFIRFLERDDVAADQFIYSFLSRDKIVTNILKIMIQGQDFRKKYWELTRSRLLHKLPLVLCDHIMTEEAKLRIQEMYSVKFEGEIPKTFWHRILKTLQCNFAKSFESVIAEGKATGKPWNEISLVANRHEEETAINFIETVLGSKVKNLFPPKNPTQENIVSLKETNDALERTLTRTVEIPSTSTPTDPPTIAQVVHNQEEILRGALIYANAMTQETLSTYVLELFRLRQ